MKQIKFGLILLLASCLLSSVKSVQAQISSTALLFDGVDDYVNVSNPSVFYDVVGANFPFTIEAWIRDDYPSGSGNESVILSSRGSLNGMPKGFTFGIVNGNLTFHTATGGWIANTINLRDGNCHHVAVARNGNGNMSVFIDGFLYSNVLPGVGDISSTLPVYIGRSNNSPAPAGFYKGIIKELRVWSNARTLSDIQSNMNTVIPGNASDLVDYWRFNDGSGSDLFNSGPIQGSGTYSPIIGNALWTTACQGCPVLPQASISASGNTTFCAGNSVTLSAVANPGQSYQWKKYGNIIPGATLSFYIADKAGSYKVVVTDFNGCSKASNTINVTVNPLPTAVISALGPLSFCAGDSVKLLANQGAGYTYQWKKYSNNIPGATSIIYTAKNAGRYKCIVTNSNGCSRISNPQFVTVPCRIVDTEQLVLSENTLNIYPNPSKGNITIDAGDLNLMAEQISLYDVAGREIKTIITMQSDDEFEIKNLKTGIYFIKIRSEEVQEVRKVVVVN